ncbi:MAG TPA: hypothetical protein VMX97_05090, partial [Hyphomicrobiaceae bacterium]|nr:hypothetical protein [Hyphomicrobiaceae bacterium]
PRRVGCHRDSSNALSDKLFKFLLERRHLGPGRQPAAAEDGNHRIDVFIVKLKAEKGNVWTCSVHVYPSMREVRTHTRAGWNCKPILHTGPNNNRVAGRQLLLPSASVKIS